MPCGGEDIDYNQFRIEREGIAAKPSLPTDELNRTFVTDMAMVHISRLRKSG
jgi:hypothetical protein